ncbi:hypothetical protein F5Y14DRAFT_446469 [Nemania sp. NC0429]|nr:hypothetical protein F5Y14DRAFT_446469 [Nemania sp. NC0429]
MEDLPVRPQGLRFQADFITAAHEARLLHIFRHELEWPEARKPGARLSLHYGYTFDYRTFGVDPAIPYRPFPAWLRPLIPRVRAGHSNGDGDGDGDRGGEGYRDPDQVCLQHYPPGAGIPPHVDTHSAYDELYALSLGSAVTMNFRRPLPSPSPSPSPSTSTPTSIPPSASASTRRESVEVDLPPRSMMQMSGDARLHWEHGIRKRKRDLLPDGTARAREDRWSITFRWLRDGGECACGDLALCDTAQRRAGVGREFRWKQKQQEQEQQQEQGEEEEVERRKGRDGDGDGDGNDDKGQGQGGCEVNRGQRRQQEKEGGREVRVLGGKEGSDSCDPVAISTQIMKGTEERQRDENDNILLSPS